MVIKQTEDFTRFCAKQLMEGEIDLCWLHLSTQKFIICIVLKKQTYENKPKQTCSPEVWAKCNFRFATWEVRHH